MNAEKLEVEIARALRNSQDNLAQQLIQLREQCPPQNSPERSTLPH